MPLSIIICFDSKTERLIDELKKSVLPNNAPRPGKKDYIRPHLTLTVSDVMTVEEGEMIVDRVSSGLTRFPVEFSAFGLFTQPQNVLYLVPALSAVLVRLYNTTHKLVGGKCRPMYCDGAWTPHCTLANDLSSDELLDALRASIELPLPIKGEISEINLFEIDPIRLVKSKTIPAEKSQS